MRMGLRLSHNVLSINELCECVYLSFYSRHCTVPVVKRGMAATHKSMVPREGESFLYQNQAGGGRERAHSYNGMRRFRMVEEMEIKIASPKGRAAFPGAPYVICVVTDNEGEEKQRNLYLPAIIRDEK
jgi:hypothetical protein